MPTQGDIRWSPQDRPQVYGVSVGSFPPWPMWHTPPMVGRRIDSVVTALDHGYTNIRTWVSDGRPGDPLTNPDNTRRGRRDRGGGQRYRQLGGAPLTIMQGPMPGGGGGGAPMPDLTPGWDFEPGVYNPDAGTVPGSVAGMSQDPYAMAGSGSSTDNPGYQGAYQGGSDGYPWSTGDLGLDAGVQGRLTPGELSEYLRQFAGVAALEGSGVVNDAGQYVVGSFGTVVLGTPSAFPHICAAGVGTAAGSGEWARRLVFRGPAGSQVLLHRELVLTTGATWNSNDTATTGQSVVSEAGAPKVLTLGEDGVGIVVLRQQCNGSLSHRWDAELTDTTQTMAGSYYPTPNWSKPPIIALNARAVLNLA